MAVTDKIIIQGARENELPRRGKGGVSARAESSSHRFVSGTTSVILACENNLKNIIGDEND